MCERAFANARKQKRKGCNLKRNMEVHLELLTISQVLTPANTPTVTAAIGVCQ